MANAAVGRINRIYPTKKGTYIRLTDSKHTLPKDDLFLLPIGHPNYGGVLACCLSGQVNNLSVQIRAEKDISTAAHAEIYYVTIDS